MADVDLRALERELRAAGTPAARLRYATALARTDHSPSEILSTLLPGIESPEVRQRIGQCFPTWTSAEFSSHDAHYIDVPPLRSEPRLKWSCSLGGQSNPETMLLASPLGIVCTARETKSIQVLDPETGEVRWEFPWQVANRPRDDDPVGYVRRWPEIVGDTLCSWDTRVFTCRDLWTGDELHSTELGADIVQIRVANDRVFAWGDRQVIAFDYAEPRKPPEPDPIWRRETPYPSGFAHHPGALIAGNNFLLLRSRSRQEPRTLALDPATGRTLGEIEDGFSHADRDGLTGSSGETHGLYQNPLAPPIWTSEGFALAMSPEFVVTSPTESGPGDRERLKVIAQNRATGERLGVLVDGVADFGAIAIARDVVVHYVWRIPPSFFQEGAVPEPMPHSTLSAHDSAGNLLWDLPYEVLGSAVMGLAPLHQRRLYGLTQDGAVFCLEPAPG